MTAVRGKKKRNILVISLLLISSSAVYLLLIRFGLLVPLPDLPGVLCLSSCPSQEKVHTPPSGNQLLNYDRAIEQLIGTAIDKRKTSILIEKSKHRLTLYYEQKPVKSYPVVFCSKPTGDKLREGDKRTPEGILHIRNLYPHPAWSKFLWLGYPNTHSWRQHFQAKVAGRIGWNSPIGGEVGIHGVPTGLDQMVDERNNWTWGCPSLKNKDVDELYSVVRVGTVVEIVP